MLISTSGLIGSRMGLLLVGILVLLVAAACGNWSAGATAHCAAVHRATHPAAGDKVYGHRA